METELMKAAPEAAETTAEAKNVKAHKISHMAKKIVGMMTSMAIMVVLGTVQAFAAGESSGGNLSGLTGTLTTVVSCIGGGVGVWGIVNLLEGYGSDNPGAKAQ